MRKGINIVLIFGFLLSSCSGTKQVAESAATQLNTYTEGELSYKQQFRFKYLFLEAQRLKALEDYDKAANSLEQCLSLDEQNDAAHYELAQIYLRQERLADAVFHASRALEINGANIWYYQLLAQLYQATGDIESELAIYIGMAELEPKNIEYQYNLAIAYSRSGMHKKALQVYNKLEKSIGINEELSIKKERLFIAMGDVDKAANELNKLINAYPNEVRYRGMLAELYQANDRSDEAIIIYKDILEINPKEPRANMALAEYYRVQNDFSKALKHLHYSFDEPYFDVDVKFQILIKYFELAMEEAQYMTAFTDLVDRAINTHPNQARFYSIKADLFFQKNNAQESFYYYGKALELGATEFAIWNRYLILGLEVQAYAKVMEKGVRAIELHPIQPTSYLFSGLAYIFTNNHEEAIPFLEKGLNYVVNNRSLKTEFYNYLAAAHHAIENHEQSDAYYEQSLALIPDNPLVLNNYSYYLSLRSKDLAKAEKMAKKAIELNPSEPTYQDTYGWVLYKLNKFVEAREWIKKAIDSSTNSPSSEVLEHYGDVLYKLNKKAEAKEFWQKALELDDSSEKLIRKVREGVLHE